MLRVQTAQARDPHPQIAVIPSIRPRESTGPGQAMVGQSPSPKKCSILCNMSVCVCVCVAYAYGPTRSHLHTHRSLEFPLYNSPAMILYQQFNMQVEVLGDGFWLRIKKRNEIF